MIRPHSISYSVLGLLFLSLPLRAANEPPWLELHSAHYTVITDAGEKRGHEVALRFEQMRSVFAGLLGKDRLNESRPLTVLAFKDDRSYYQLAPLHQGQPIAVPGFFLPGSDQDFIALSLTEAEPWRAVAHDFALRLLTYNYPPVQGWFDEGLAEYFSSIRVDNREVEIGGDPQLQPAVIDDLTGKQSGAQSPKSPTELLESQAWLSLPDLFTVKHDPSSRNELNGNLLYYAESWMVMHYLLHEKRLPETGQYFGLTLNQHLPVEEAIKQAYGMSSTELEQAVKAYFNGQAALRNSSETDRFPAPIGPDDSTITAKPFTEADARALYAGIQIRIPERREIGLQTLKELATTPTEADKKAEQKPAKRIGEDAEQLPTNAIGNELAHRFLAWDHIEHNEFEEAFHELGDAASLDPRDMWVRYYLCVAKYRVAQSKQSEIPGLANMILDLKAVLDWNPEMADAYDLLAVARNAGGSSTSAMESERAAIGLNPRDRRYLLHLSQAYVTAKRYEAAKALLARLKEDDDPKIAAAAADLLAQMGAQKKYGPAATAAANQQQYEKQKTPFDVLDEDAAKRDAAENNASHSTADTRITKYVKGRLVSVDCSNPPTAVLTVTSATGTMKLRAADYKALLLIGADDFSCGWRDRQVTANYKSSGPTDGDLVSLEMR